MSETKKMRTEKTRKALLDLCDYLPAGIVGLEIGSFAGESSEVFMKSGKFKKLYCVDPWDTNACTQNDAERRFDAVKAKYKAIVKCKGLLDDHHQHIDPVHFTYIDARHEFVHTLMFIFQAILLSRLPCFIGGHDYRCKKFPGVTEAVNLVIGEDNLRTFPDKSFLTIIKPAHKTEVGTCKPKTKYNNEGKKI